jgi:hypothetical protein
MEERGERRQGGEERMRMRMREWEREREREKRDYSSVSFPSPLQ